MKSIQHSIMTVLLSLGLLSDAGAEFSASQPTTALKQPKNHLVLMLDCSGSYRERQAEAIQKTAELIDRMADSPLHRWETGTDEISIISIDALPEKLWNGSTRELKELKPEDWQARLVGREDYRLCTDVVGAFQLAVKTLGEDSPMLSKYLVIFSDLKHEPPLDSITKCAPPVPVSKYPSNFPWEQLRNVSVSAYWVPKDGKYQWTMACREHGLEDNFKIYTESEAASMQIQPPPKAKENVSEEVKKERAQNLLAKYWTTFRTALKLTGYGLAGVTALFMMAGLIGRLLPRRRFRRSAPQRRVMTPRPNGIRPVPAPVRRALVPPQPGPR